MGRRLARTDAIRSPLGIIRSPSGVKTKLRPNDDFAERRKNALTRREEILRNTPSKTASPAAGGSPRPIRLDREQLEELYHRCVRLSAENKINAKNSWGLNLIDHMSDMVRNQETNFQMASCTLDASVKIFSYRVDSVHNETYKVLGGLTRQQQKNAKDGEQDGEGGSQKRRRATHHNVQTIETNVEGNLNLRSAEIVAMETADPLHQRTSRTFDAGSANGMLMNQWPLGFHGQIEVGDDVHVPEADVEETADEEEEDEWIDLSAIPNGDDIWSNIEACTSDRSMFSTVLFRRLVGLDDRTQPENVEAQQQATNDILEMGDNDDDIAELDFHDAGVDGADVDQQEERLFMQMQQEGAEEVFYTDEAPNAGIPSKDDQTLDFVLRLVHKDDGSGTSPEYTYLDVDKLRNWAGPEHWKFTRQKRAAADAGPKSTSKKSREPFRIDFTAASKTDEKTIRKALANVAKSTTTLSAKTQASSKVQTTLPEDLHYDLNSLVVLFNKAHFDLRRRVRARNGEEGTASPSGQWYNYENANDTSNFCAGDMGVDLGGDLDFVDDDNDDMDIGAEAVGHMGAENVPAASLFPAEGVAYTANGLTYATRMKQIDVRALKTGIWNSLENSGDGVTFSNVLHQLPSTLPPGQVSQVSVPFAFMALLHLANEKHLRITSAPTMDELTVTDIVSGA